MNRALRNCLIAPAKIGRYLLDLSSDDGAAKARFFIRFGFDPSRPQQLEAALLEHAATQAIVETWTDAWGEHWNVLGPLSTPSGERPTIRSGWVKDSAAPPRLATALPGPKPRR